MIRIIVKIPKVTGRSDCDVKFSAGKIPIIFSQFNYKTIEVNGTTITMSDPYAKIDLGGIAKGYIADQVKNYLIEEGIEHAYINLGGKFFRLS